MGSIDELADRAVGDVAREAGVDPDALQEALDIAVSDRECVVGTELRIALRMACQRCVPSARAIEAMGTRPDHRAERVIARLEALQCAP
ncbi:MAG: hypothetical protein GYA36_21120 [Veillonellaceae bacterium]|nr:hypothetical protein [Veillonellaceae bacterium]